MGQREQLQQLLEEVAGETHEVYFQPPANLVMTYPCIVYKRDGVDTKFADDKPYSVVKRYMVTVIDRSPDSPILDRVLLLPQCTHSRSFTVDNLNHDVFILYF